MEFSVESMLWTTVATLICVQLFKFLYKVWWTPSRLEKALRNQGLKGPPRLSISPLGNILEVVKARYSQHNTVLDKNDHDILRHVFPDHTMYTEKYGDMFLYWWATEPRVNIQRPELLREVLSRKAESFGKSPFHVQLLEDILGSGTVSANGEKWTYHRKIVSPAFHLERLKRMTGTVVDCTMRMVERWQQNFAEGRPEAELDVSEELAILTSDAISRIAFGGSYESGRRAFQILNLLIVLHVKAFVYSWIPLARLLPIKINRDIWRNEKEVTRLLSIMVEERRSKVKSGAWETYGDDLLGMILTESQNINTKFDSRSIIGECKTMHVAGNDTTSSMLTWTLFLLSLHPEWQDRVRAEAFEVCGDRDPDAEMLGKLKQISMVLNESLRLYPPGGLMFRQCFEDVQLGDLMLPKGTAINISVIAVHHDKSLWGEDANEFRPERFEQGVSKACRHPHAFMPFSYGPRVCVGMNLSLIEGKVALAILLRRFHFRVSPTYRHCPSHLLTLKPNFGMQLLVRQL